MYWLIQKLCYGIRELATSAAGAGLSCVCQASADLSRPAHPLPHFTAIGSARFCAISGVFFEQYRRALPFMFIVAGLILLGSRVARRDTGNRKETL